MREIRKFKWAIIGLAVGILVGCGPLDSLPSPPGSDSHPAQFAQEGLTTTHDGAATSAGHPVAN